MRATKACCPDTFNGRLSAWRQFQPKGKYGQESMSTNQCRRTLLSLATKHLSPSTFLASIKQRCPPDCNHQQKLSESLRHIPPTLNFKHIKEKLLSTPSPVLPLLAGQHNQAASLLRFVVSLHTVGSACMYDTLSRLVVELSRN
jgi:hypothetical protein